MKGIMKELPSWYVALVTFGVLVDGREAPRYLRGDTHYGDQLSAFAEVLATGAPEISLPLSATLLREALNNNSSDEVKGHGNSELAHKYIEAP